MILFPSRPISPLSGDLPDTVLSGELHYISPWVPTRRDALTHENNQLHERDKFIALVIGHLAVQLSLGIKSITDVVSNNEKKYRYFL